MCQIRFNPAGQYVHNVNWFPTGCGPYVFHSILIKQEQGRATAVQSTDIALDQICHDQAGLQTNIRQF